MWDKRVTLTLTILFLLGGMVLPVEAAIYKWKDDAGKTHFTDDPTKVPEAFRKKPFLKGFRTPNETSKVWNKGNSDKKGDSSDIKNLHDEPEKSEKENKFTEAHRAAAEAAVNFLNSDIPRYDKFYTWPPSRSKFRLLKQAVAGATPQKQTLLNQVSQHQLPIFQEIAGFLQTSIAEDEKSQKILPTTITSTRQTQALMNRLKSETPQENTFLEKLNSLLNSNS